MKLNFKISGNNFKLMCISSIIAVILNVILSYTVGSLAPKDKSKKDFLSKLLYYFENSKNNLIANSILVALYVLISVYFGNVLLNSFKKAPPYIPPVPLPQVGGIE